MKLAAASKTIYSMFKMQKNSSCSLKVKYQLKSISWDVQRHVAYNYLLSSFSPKPPNHPVYCRFSTSAIFGTFRHFMLQKPSCFRSDVTSSERANRRRASERSDVTTPETGSLVQGQFTSGGDCAIFERFRSCSSGRNMQQIKLLILQMLLFGPKVTTNPGRGNFISETPR